MENSYYNVEKKCNAQNREKDQEVFEEHFLSSPICVLLWSLILSPIMGAYVLKNNWEKINDKEKHDSSNIWLTSLVAVYVFVFLFLFSWIKLFLVWALWVIFEWQKYHSYLKKNTSEWKYNSITMREAIRSFVNALVAGYMNWVIIFKTQIEQWKERELNGKGNMKQVISIFCILIFLVFFGLSGSPTNKSLDSLSPEELLDEYRERAHWLISETSNWKNRWRNLNKIDEMIDPCKRLIKIARNSGKDDRIIVKELDSELSKLFDESEAAAELLGLLDTSYISSDYVKYGSPQRVLIKCVKKRDFKHIDELFSIRRVDINGICKDGVNAPRTALSCAIDNSDEEMVEYLLDKGAVPHPYHVENVSILKLLIKYGCEIDVDYLASYLRENKQKDVVFFKTMIDAVSDINCPLSMNPQLPQLCVQYMNSSDVPERCFEVFKYMLKNKLNPDIKREGYYDTTPLLDIVGQNTEWSVKCANELIEAGANVNAKDHHQNTALHHIVDNKNIEAVINSGVLPKLITEFTINSINDNGYTPLGYAIHEENYEIAKFFLDHGADPNGKHTYRDYHGKQEENVLFMAVLKGNYEMVKTLLDKGADPNVRSDFDGMVGDNGYTPLLLAVLEDNVEISQLLINSGADCFPNDKKYKCIIEFAKSSKMKEMLSPYCIQSSK